VIAARERRIEANSMLLLLLISLGAAFCFAIVGVLYKLVALKPWSDDGFRLVMMALGTFAAGLVWLAGTERPNSTVIYLSLLCGVFGLISLFSVMRSMALGSGAATWVVLNLSITLVILLAPWLWRESISARQWSGIAAFVISVFLFARDRGEGDKRPISLRWAVPATLMFFMNGLTVVVFKVLDRAVHAPHTFSTLTIYYGTTTVLLIPVFMYRRWKDVFVKGPEMLTGFVAALGMMVGQALLLKAISIDATTSIPVIHGVNVLVVAIASSFLFNEKFTRYSTTGVLAGVASIWLLMMPR
jgi:drug/metabolite transporter (DMT)-like permease